MANDKTKYVYVEGKAKWARLYDRNMDTKYGEKFKVDLYIDDKNWKILQSTGYRGELRHDSDGAFVKLSRNNKQQFQDGMYTLGPPKVVDKQGNHFEANIGNDSILKVLLEIYNSKYGVGSRIKEVIVLEHVEYVRPPDIDMGDPIGLPA